MSAPSQNYFQAVAYRLESGALEEVPLTSDILAPVEGDVLPPGPTTVREYAFAGHGRGITRVEVSADGGRTWLNARIDNDLGPWAWRLWQATVDLSAGPAEIFARAWDGSTTQPESAESIWNPKGYVNNSCPRVQVLVGSAP